MAELSIDEEILNSLSLLDDEQKEAVLVRILSLLKIQEESGEVSNDESSHSIQ